MKKKSTLKLVVITLCFLTSTLVFSQEKPFRIGVKIGFPNIVGGNLEYVLPLLKNRLSVSMDYTNLKADKYLDDGDSGSASYIEGGFNYYFGKEGRGAYGGISYGSFKGDVTSTDLNSENSDKTGGVGVVDIDNSSLNIKLGAKLGGLFYFRPELGFAFSAFPKTIDQVITFPDGSVEIESVLAEDDLPGIATSGLMFNIGFGFSF